MLFKENDSIRYLTFDSLTESGLIHGVFTRRGGISPKPWESLNVGGTVGDEQTRVIKNREAIFTVFDRDPGSIYDVWQVHGNEVVCTTHPRQVDDRYEMADAILTDCTGVSLFMRFADCVPIILHDPNRKVAGIVHAGWQGTVRQTVVSAVKQMQARYKCKPENILAGIGPSIGPDHYEIGPEVANRIYESFEADADSILISDHGNYRLDLWRANAILMARAGIRQVEIAEVCTACHLDDWYSHRAETGKTGRFGVLAALPA